MYCRGVCSYGGAVTYRCGCQSVNETSGVDRGRSRQPSSTQEPPADSHLQQILAVLAIEHVKWGCRRSTLGDFLAHFVQYIWRRGQGEVPGLVVFGVYALSS